MKLSDGEKLILAMLCDLYGKLGVDGDIDPKFVKEAINSGNLWGIKSKYHGLFHDEETSAAVKDETAKFLDMWGFIEEDYAELSGADKARVAAEGGVFGEDPKFLGFDGNNETEYTVASQFLTDELEQIPGFAGRGGLNSHVPVVPMYRRMSEVFRDIRRSPSGRRLNADQIIAILQAAEDPGSR